MESLHGFLHGILKIMFHGLPKLASGPPSRGRLNINSSRPCQSYKNEGPSQLYDHSPWLMYEVALGFKWIDLDKQSFKTNQKIKDYIFMHYNITQL